MANRLSLIAILAATLLAATNANAQRDPKAAVVAIDSVVKAYSHFPDIVTPFIANVCSKFKKDPEVYTGVAKAYYKYLVGRDEDGRPYYTYVIRDSTTAYKYLRQAIAVQPSYAPAYIFAGDIQRTYFNRPAALAWYKKAVDNNPTEPAGYIAYAEYMSETNADSAAMMLEQLLKVDSLYPVYLTAARLYYDRANRDKTVECYDKADMKDMIDTDFIAYATCLMLQGNAQRGFAVADSGSTRYPRNAAINRLALYNGDMAKLYDQAMDYGDKLFNHSDTTTFVADDYMHYGNAYMGKNRYAQAVEMYEKLLTFPKLRKSTRTPVVQNMMKAYNELGESGKAIDVCKAYIAQNEKEDVLDAYDMNILASEYRNQAELLNGADKLKALERSDSVYAVLADKFPKNADFAYYLRLQLAAMRDPESTQGVGLPIAQRLETIIIAKGERNEQDNARLLYAYRYLGYYYTIVKKQMAKGKPYWQKIYEIDPENKSAIYVLKELYKMKI